MSRRAGSFLLFLMMLALSVAMMTSCARSVTLGLDEAVEVMVLDGVDRTRATCIVTALDGRLDLRKVTGLDPELDENDLLLLSATSADCAPAVAPSEVDGELPEDPLSVADAPPIVTLDDVEDEIARRVADGLDPAVADCLVVRLAALPDPRIVLDDDVRFSELVVDCRRAS
ncbi:MAG: hypothetical protein RIB98_04715 [Acidimicrobiales bacterium]